MFLIAFEYMYSIVHRICTFVYLCSLCMPMVESWSSCSSPRWKLSQNILCVKLFVPSYVIKMTTHFSELQYKVYVRKDLEHHVQPRKKAQVTCHCDCRLQVFKIHCGKITAERKKSASASLHEQASEKVWLDTKPSQIRSNWSIHRRIKVTDTWGSSNRIAAWVFLDKCWFRSLQGCLFWVNGFVRHIPEVGNWEDTLL